MTEPKPWYASKTVWVAVIQALIGIVVAFQTNYPDIQAAGWVAVGKSFLDLILRAITDRAIE